MGSSVGPIPDSDVSRNDFREAEAGTCDRLRGYEGRAPAWPIVLNLEIPSPSAVVPLLTDSRTASRAG